MPDSNQVQRKLRIVIASPALAQQNNGNWQTASRWAGFLADSYAVDIVPEWQSGDAAPDLLIALHARRSAPSLAAFTEAFAQRPSVLVLTGTDLYRDIAIDASAAHSLELASALVLLQPAGMAYLPEQVRARAHVIYQSAEALAHDPARSREICMLGHLRDEKDPLTFMRAASLVPHTLVHIGAALDPALERAARDTQAAQANYHWLGALPREAARARLARSHAMVIASRMEGGANVIIEAVTSGVPVLASAIDGNRGMLGDDYAGYFAPGDATALAALIARSFEPGLYARLQAQCAARARLFAPAAEKAALRELVDNLLHASSHPTHRQESP
ncbi:selenoneine biosynthesis selenosugar synthase SenB [Massilia sp. S19_KUP03_FR1]|uniref:selenoneine biosynthesis selenosugar synthase SenB n=1 Tax=Massilia sp. S19_KUP03_FR1 TaxID=3025503 RepID=UPI002FCDBB97